MSSVLNIITGNGKPCRSEERTVDKYDKTPGVPSENGRRIISKQGDCKDLPYGRSVEFICKDRVIREDAFEISNRYAAYNKDTVTNNQEEAQNTSEHTKSLKRRNAIRKRGRKITEKFEKNKTDKLRKENHYTVENVESLDSVFTDDLAKIGGKIKTNVRQQVNSIELNLDIQYGDQQTFGCDDKWYIPEQQRRHQAAPSSTLNVSGSINEKQTEVVELDQIRCQNKSFVGVVREGNANERIVDFQGQCENISIVPDDLKDVFGGGERNFEKADRTDQTNNQGTIPCIHVSEYNHDEQQNVLNKDVSKTSVQIVSTACEGKCRGTFGPRAVLRNQSQCHPNSVESELIGRDSMCCSEQNVTSFSHSENESNRSSSSSFLSVRYTHSVFSLLSGHSSSSSCSYISVHTFNDSRQDRLLSYPELSRRALSLNVRFAFDQDSDSESYISVHRPASFRRCFSSCDCSLVSAGSTLINDTITWSPPLLRTERSTSFSSLVEFDNDDVFTNKETCKSRDEYEKNILFNQKCIHIKSPQYRCSPIEHYLEESLDMNDLDGFEEKNVGDTIHIYDNNLSNTGYDNVTLAYSRQVL